MSGLRAQLRLARKGFVLDLELATEGRGITALFGASGSGKTTALRCIAGLERAPGGRVVFGSECWQDEGAGLFVPPHQRSCGYVFQEASLFAHLSVLRNLEYGMSRVPAAQRRLAFEHTVELLAIGSLLSRQPESLSGGERQRVAIARALLASPRLLLMDEPLASLDASRKGEILYYIERLRDELGIPILYVSHSIEEVVRLADAVIELAGGKVTGVGPALGRLEGGSVLDARVVEQDLESGLARLEFAGGTLYAPDLDALVGERVRVRVNARDVSLATERPRAISMLNVMAGTVATIAEGAGASAEVQLDVGGAPILARITRRSVQELGLAPGKPVFALIKAVAIDRRSVGYA